MFEFHNYLHQSENYPDEVPYFIETAPWEMAVALNRYLRDIGEHSEIIVPKEDRKAPVYVKVDNKIYSSFGEEDAATLDIGWKVIGEQSINKFADKSIEDMRRDVEAAGRVISKAVDRALIEIIKKGPKQCNPNLFEMKMLRASQQGFDIKRIMYHETEMDNEFDIRTTGFDLSRTGARGSDETMPDGVFVKPTPVQIDVAMEPVQMPMILKKGKVKTFFTRELLEDFLKDDFSYKELSYKVVDVDNKYNALYEELEEKLVEVLKVSGRRSDERKAVRGEVNELLEEWRVEIRKVATLARARATEIFKEMGIDMVRIERDSGSFGRVVDTTIILNPDNIRSLKDSFEITSKRELTDNSMALAG